MANEEQLSILRQGVDVWNKWRKENPNIEIDFSKADFFDTDLSGVNFNKLNLSGANLGYVALKGASFKEAELTNADFWGANLNQADFTDAVLLRADFSEADLSATNLNNAEFGATVLGRNDLSNSFGLDNIRHVGASIVDIQTIRLSKGTIPTIFLRGCGLSDWEIEQSKLYDPNLSNDQFIDIQNRIFDLHNGKSIQVSPLFISYSHGDGRFVDKLETKLNEKGIRFWRDIHDMKAGRIETQIDRAINQNRTVLLVLSENSLSSDWVEHEVRTARGLEKDTARDALCPIALDDSWKNSQWPKRIMEQIMEYNILDFSDWKNDNKFESIFRKLADGLELFYKE